MTARSTLRVITGLCWILLASCRTAEKRVAPTTPSPDLQRQLKESREQLHRYEKRYGKLTSKRPAHDFRKLRVELKGKSMNVVRARLGKPDDVYTFGTSESWDYVDAAYDPLSGRTVHHLEIWFHAGVEAYLKASF